MSCRPPYFSLDKFLDKVVELRRWFSLYHVYFVASAFLFY